MRLRILTSADLLRALPMPEAIAAMKAAFAAFSGGRAQAPLRTRLEIADQGAVALVMPAFLPARGDLAVKVVNVFPRNPAPRLPIIHALVLAFDPATGEPRALLEGGSLTALRTGAASGAATDLLARPEASVLAVFGSGVQARTQIAAVCTVREIREVRIFSLDPTGAEALAAELRKNRTTSASLRVVETPEQAASGADVICTATTSATPVFPDRALDPGTHVNAIGAYTPEMQEIDPDTVARAGIFVDSRSAALAEAGDLIQPLRAGRITEASIQAELGQVVLGLHPGRTDPDQVTLFKSVGLAVQDAAAAGAVVRQSEALGLGTVVEI